MPAGPRFSALLIKFTSLPALCASTCLDRCQAASGNRTTTPAETGRGINHGRASIPLFWQRRQYVPSCRSSGGLLFLVAVPHTRSEWDIVVDETLETQKALNLHSLQSTRPIHSAVSTPAEIDAASDTIAYDTGAAVLRMIEAYMGRDGSQKGVTVYLKTHA